ncbi:MAG TPA: PHP domain-containing protein [Chthonomonadaceae bacterium]|nr:PHP domain-containing protein [Chthonomonadaceae bacterium]
MPETDRSIDLHAHTTASDGDHTPTQLVEKAAQIGLTALAITDHDTTAGIPEALEAGRRIGLEIVPGIELSVEYANGQCHILGLLIDPENRTLPERLREIQHNRATRNARIVERMRTEYGLDVTLDEIKEVAGGKIVARPHFAKVLLAKGYVSTMQEAFDEYLAEGAKAYVPKDTLSSAEAIALIHRAGGVAVLAHPNNLKRDVEETEAEIRRMQSEGLDGIEARYSKHAPEDNTHYLALAERLGLLTSGGSDFHGPSVRPEVALGQVENIGQEGPRVPAPVALLAALKIAQRPQPR